MGDEAAATTRRPSQVLTWLRRFVDRRHSFLIASVFLCIGLAGACLALGLRLNDLLLMRIAAGVFVATSGLAGALVAMEADRQRRRHASAVTYIQGLRNYTVETIEPLRSTVQLLESERAPLPPEEVPTDLDDSADTPLGTKERNVLLSIIAVLCKELEIDYSRPAKAAVAIKESTLRHGFTIGETTIENHLKKLPEAVAARTK